MPEPSPSTTRSIVGREDPTPIHLDTDADALAPAAPQAAAAVAHVPQPRVRRPGGPALWLAAGWLGLVVFLAVFADLLPFVGSPDQLYRDRREPPGFSYLFGTDKIGYDVFARTVHGARFSLIIAVTSIAFGLVFGGLLGMLAGYYRGKVDAVISAVSDVVLAFPALILLLTIVSFLGRGAPFIILALSILSIPPLTRVVRALTMTYAQREFVLAAKAVGAKDGRILFKEILPNLVPSMLSFGLTGLAVLIIAEGALAFLGLSVQGQPTWGRLIDAGRADLEVTWWVSLMPSFVMFLTILAINVLGDIFSKRFEIKESLL